ncbi:hypothetical protein BKA67DRAFT_160242 [Truncatella angustata]|uniref:Uncharacterized protein n=1 Tax=Truncatella angustata TaxID=152316 RepID=A0A9P8UR05_9PEZI|nr:uncharacterized protein BKA67DRAFT_160242 [Truncatella angustata]KAH6656611.1 hypothetical protein BKA67DRAFT_160242 [Truncatella angustata]
MSQQPQSAKRMRSNTSNEFTPQTAPALRGRPSQLDVAGAADVNVALYSHSHSHSHSANVNVNVYDSTFATIPSTRQDVGYSSYVSAAQHNDYPAAAYGEPYDPHPHANSYTIAHGLPPPSDYSAAFAGYYSPDIVSSIQNPPFSPVTARNSTSTGAETYSPSPIPGSSAATSLSDLQGHSAGSVPPHGLSQQFDDVYGSQSVPHPTTHHAQTLSYPDAVVNSQYTPPSEAVINSQYSIPPPNRTGANGHHQSPALPEPDEGDSDEDAQGETADEADSIGVRNHLPAPNISRTF